MIEAQTIKNIFYMNLILMILETLKIFLRFGIKIKIKIKMMLLKIILKKNLMELLKMKQIKILLETKLKEVYQIYLNQKK